MFKPSALDLSGNRRLVDGITMFIVTGLSLLLLVYVGIGEGKRTYEQLEIEKLTSQGRNLQASIENNLRAGLPLKQFAGFSSLAIRFLNGIDEVDAVAVYDQCGHQSVHCHRQKKSKVAAAVARHQARQAGHRARSQAKRTLKSSCRCATGLKPSAAW